jgi:acyl carrier protein
MKVPTQEIILACLQELNEVLHKPELQRADKDTNLYGRKGVLDSLNLVALLSDIEGRISEEYEVPLVIADERALSESRSPFKTVQTLSEYIERLIQEKGSA